MRNAKTFFKNISSASAIAEQKARIIIKYEKTRQEFYESELHNMAAQLVEVLDKGYFVEIGRSRSGLKIFAVSRKHQVVQRRENLHE